MRLYPCISCRWRQVVSQDAICNTCHGHAAEVKAEIEARKAAKAKMYVQENAIANS